MVSMENVNLPVGRIQQQHSSSSFRCL